MGPRVKKVRSAKTKESSVVAEKEIIKEEDETNGSTEQVDKTAVDHGEELPPLSKGRARQKKTIPSVKDIKEEPEDDVNGQTETKEDIPVQAKKARGRKKKVNEQDSEEVIPKKKDRTMKKNETPKEAEITEEVDEKPLEEEPKQEKAKREKRVPVKKGGKKKKDQDEEEKLSDEMSVEAVDDQASKNKDDEEEEKNEDEDGGGDAKASKKGKAAAKTSTVPPTKKKAAPRGKKAQLSKADNELKEKTDVEVDGKRLRVAVEHCKS